MRNSADDQSQRMLNALEPGTVMPIHRHKYETVVYLRGRVVDEFYDNAGVLADFYRVGALQPIVAVKDGKYEAVGEEDILSLNIFRN